MTYKGKSCKIEINGYDMGLSFEGTRNLYRKVQERENGQLFIIIEGCEIPVREKWPNTNMGYLIADWTAKQNEKIE